MPTRARTGSQDRRALSTTAGRQLLRLFDARTQARPWPLGSQPFPLIVLEAAEPGVAVDDYVTELERTAAEAGIPHIVPVPAEPPGDDAPEIALLDAMTKESAWNGLRHGFGRFRVPRSDLVRSFEQAAESARSKNAARPGSTTPMDESGRHQIMLPQTLTVYYTTFNHLPNLVAGGRDQTNAFFVLARNVLGISAAPLLSDGQMVLTYDCTSALAQAAQKAFNTLGLTVRDRERRRGAAW